MAGQFDGDDIWGFSAHDTSGQMDLTDSLRLSAGGYFLTSSTGEQIPPAELVGAHMGGAIDENGLDMSHLQAVGQHPHLMGDGSLQTSSYVMDSHHLTPDPESSDLRFSTGVEMNLTSSNPPYIKPEYTSPGQAPATVAFETYGTLPPANKKKRRREHDVIEATIQYGNGNGPVITTPQSVASSSSHHSGSEASYGSHGHDSNGQDDIVYVDNIPEQQQTPVLPRDHIQPYLDDFYDIRLNVIALRPQQYRILKQEKSRIGEQKETIQRLSARLQAIEEAFLALKTEAILHPSDINRMFCIQPDLHSCRVQLELYMNEINHTLSPNEAWKSTELVLEEHPFPISLKQKENVPKVVVRLLTGACTNITHVSAVEARVVSTSTGSPKPPEMINYQEKMRLTAYHREAEQAQQNEAGGQGYTAVFENLNFLTGTRMKDFSLVFTCKVSLGGGKSEFNETIPTPPFVVFTNGNQWNDIEGILLRWEAFGGSSTTVWCRLANSLQRRYIMATMQLPEEPQRPLSRSDFTFLFQTKIDPKLIPTPNTVVNDKQYTELWQWLGEGLHRLHVNAKLLKCWTSGYIIGFISRDSARAVLLNRARGTFIVRFSESSPGRLAVSFAIVEYNNNIEVGNYLTTPDEARSLPDTVRDYSNLTSVVRVTEPSMEHITYAASAKDATFGTMYSKIHPGQNTVSGYMKTMVSNGR